MYGGGAQQVIAGSRGVYRNRLLVCFVGCCENRIEDRVPDQTEFLVLTSVIPPQLLTFHPSLTAPPPSVSSLPLSLVLTSTMTGSNGSPDSSSAAEGG